MHDRAGEGEAEVSAPAELARAIDGGATPAFSPGRLRCIVFAPIPAWIQPR